MQDAEFVHLFPVYLLLKDEDEYCKWPERGLLYMELIAERGFDHDINYYVLVKR